MKKLLLMVVIASHAAMQQAFRVKNNGNQKCEIYLVIQDENRVTLLEPKETLVPYGETSRNFVTPKVKKIDFMKLSSRQFAYSGQCFGYSFGYIKINNYSQAELASAELVFTFVESSDEGTENTSIVANYKPGKVPLESTGAGASSQQESKSSSASSQTVSSASAAASPKTESKGRAQQGAGVQTKKFA